MTKAYNFVVISIFYLVVSLCIILFFNPDYVISVLIVLTGIFITVVILQSIRLLSKQNEMRAKKMIDNLSVSYRQIESLFAIYSSLNIETILPPFRGWAISPDFASLILSKMKETKPANVLECGSGISTVLIAYYLKKTNKGHLYSFEHDRDYAESTLDLLKRHDLLPYVTIYNTDLIEHNINGKTWKWYDTDQMDKDIKFDLVVIDGPPYQIQQKSRYPALPILDEYFNPKAVILIDDCAREQDNEVINDWLAEFKYFESQWFDTEKGAFVLSKRNV